MHENMKTSMWHTGRSERTCRLPACLSKKSHMSHHIILITTLCSEVKMSASSMSESA